MSYPEIGFWLCAGCVLYTYLVYPLVLGVLSRLVRRPIRQLQPAPRSFSIVLAARDEAERIERRLEELTGLLQSSGLEGEIIVVSDGSTDATAALARGFADRGVQVLELPVNEGKASALSLGCAAAQYEILVFADVRQTWAPDVLPRLLASFTDPEVGAVSGDLIIECPPGLMNGVGLYWRFEKWLRRRESLVWSTVGATGAISACRRRLFRPIPRGTILDDVYWPLQVALQGYRVVHNSGAHAFDRLPERPRDEFHRKVRTLSGNFQVVRLLPAALLPWRNPIWIQLVSHKLLRLVVPWALLALLVCNCFLTGPFYLSLLWCQVAFYGLGLLGLWAGARHRLAGAVGSFLVLNAASWYAFWVWISGRTGRSWRKTIYTRVRTDAVSSGPGEIKISVPAGLSCPD